MLECLGYSEKSNTKGISPRKRKPTVETLEARHLLSVSRGVIPATPWATGRSKMILRTAQIIITATA